MPPCFININVVSFVYIIVIIVTAVHFGLGVLVHPAVQVNQEGNVADLDLGSHYVLKYKYKLIFIFLEVVYQV